jgi:hypothetical protein
VLISTVSVGIGGVPISGADGVLTVVDVVDVGFSTTNVGSATTGADPDGSVPDPPHATEATERTATAKVAIIVRLFSSEDMPINLRSPDYLITSYRNSAAGLGAAVSDLRSHALQGFFSSLQSLIDVILFDPAHVTDSEDLTDE